MMQDDHKAFLLSRGWTSKEIEEYEITQDTPLDELISSYVVPLKFDIPLDQFFKEMTKLGWSKATIDSYVKSVLPEPDDITDDEIPLRQFLHAAPEKEPY